ncbi:Sec-independent protein translocase TatB [Streptomyces broussonetiae]|uniref:Sec-independent protein translocase TatB n=1 Tax=Streptomyces broussonetiae TaxID=2686304 RepID=A0A6I6NIA4_9ACTN|nr:Sec-independent protein translocase subunit TatB [Streptomyces broussonetiae]QHA10020.1 Sec-independent protein translocase TatB [Streptomyces broussonetiae]
MFNFGPLEIASLVVLGLILFGPDKLPKMISEVGGFIRKVREFSDSTKHEIRNELGPEFQDFEFQDLNPKAFVRKQLSRHGDELGLSEMQELRNGLTKDALAAPPTLRAAHVDPHSGSTGRPLEVTPPAAGEPTPYDRDLT